MKETNASGFFFDFVETVLAIALGSFVLFYFILGDRFFLAQQIVKAVTPLSIFLIIFLIKTRINRRKIKKLKKDDKFDEIFVELTAEDKRRDFYIIVIAVISVILLPLLTDRIIYGEDLAQSFSILLLLFLWHSYMFRKRDHGEAMYVNKIDKARDEIFIFVIPVVALLAPLMIVNVDLIDILQAIISYGIVYLWRNYMYRHAINR